MMRYHDIDDMRGKVGMKRDSHGPLPRIFNKTIPEEKRRRIDEMIENLKNKEQ